MQEDTGRGEHPSVSLETSFFNTIYLKKLGISGDLSFLLKRSSLGTSDIRLLLPKGNYICQHIYIYSLLHGRDPIPCRTTYIEYRSPVNIFIIFLRITTEFHWFSLQNSFFLKFYDTSRGGYPSVSLKNSFFLIQYKKKFVISGDLFFF